MADVCGDLIGVQRPELAANPAAACQVDACAPAQEGSALANEEDAEYPDSVERSLRIRVEHAADLRQDPRLQSLGVIDHQKHMLCSRASLVEKACELLAESLRCRQVR
jgi:hypothetical protein